VRLRGVDPHPGQVPRADLDLGLHRVPVAPAVDPGPRGQEGAAAGHAEWHPVRRTAHHRGDPGEPPAGRRLGPRAGGAASVPGRPGAAGTGRHVSGGLPYRLIATDLDGTLLRDDHSVSRRTRDALTAATAAGAAHLVVTGRAVPWTRPILDDLGYTGLAVCGQGAQVYDAGAHRLLTSVTLDRQLAGLALAKIEAEVGPLYLAASRDGLDGEVLVGPGYEVQGALPAIPF